MFNNLLLNLTIPELKKSYGIGDVHGCYHTLIDLLKELPYDSNLFFLGDLCDKGNFSKDVFDFVFSNSNTINKIFILRGNHENLFLNFSLNDYLKEKKSIWYSSETFGGKKTIDSYLNSTNFCTYKDLEKDLFKISSLPNYILINNYYFLTHGFGLPYFKRRNKEKYQIALTNNRIESNTHKKDWEDYTNYKIINIFGHTVFNEVEKGQNYFGIDTGCVYGNKLTAINLFDFSITSVETNKLDIEKK